MIYVEPRANICVIDSPDEKESRFVCELPKTFCHQSVDQPGGEGVWTSQGAILSVACDPFSLSAGNHDGAVVIVGHTMVLQVHSMAWEMHKHVFPVVSDQNEFVYCFGGEGSVEYPRRMYLADFIYVHYAAAFESVVNSLVTTCHDLDGAVWSSRLSLTVS